MNGRDVLRAAVEKLSAAGIENPRLEARLLLEQGGDFENLLVRRIAREPLAYITGHKEFWSLNFEVGPGALIPRPETETLIEEAQWVFPDAQAPLRILDLGTGSGCLLVTALTLYPHARGTGVDCSPEALVWARRNANRHGVAARATFIEGGWDAASGPFDLVLCNPPYVSAGDMADLAPELNYEPLTALVAGADGLAAYRALAPVLSAVLAPEGCAVVELGAGQAEAACAVFAEAGLEIAGMAPDLAGISRALVLGRTS